MSRMFDQIDSDQYVTHSNPVPAKTALSFIAWKQANPKLPACKRCECPEASHSEDRDNYWISWCSLCGAVCGEVEPKPWKELVLDYAHPDEELFGHIPGDEQPEWSYNYGDAARPVFDQIQNTTEYAHMSGANNTRVRRDSDVF